MYDMSEVDERYTDQARIHVKVIGDDQLAPPVEEWFVTIDTGESVDRAYLRDALIDALSPPNYRLSEQHNVIHWGQRVHHTTSSSPSRVVPEEHSRPPRFRSN